MRIRMLFAAAAVVACFSLMSSISEAGGRITYYSSPFPYVGPAPVYSVPAPVNTAYYVPAMNAYYAPALVPAPVMAPVYYQTPVVVQPVTTYYAPAVSTYSYYGPGRVVYKSRGPRFLAPNYKTVVKYR
ncbi:hypothetical protein [Gimesia maris]|uniref:hypothetical protein n=1 Tax=Gimesia maris TaxID=122 RepID=UPI00241F5515|nr:hypothetical protein [Gimesia maris]